MFWQSVAYRLQCILQLNDETSESDSDLVWMLLSDIPTPSVIEGPLIILNADVCFLKLLQRTRLISICLS